MELRERWPLWTFLAIAGLAAAAVLLPLHRALLLRLLEFAALPVEVALLAWIGTRTVRALRHPRSTPQSGDALEQIGRTTRDILSAGHTGEVIAFEVAVCYLRAVLMAHAAARAVARPSGDARLCVSHSQRLRRDRGRIGDADRGRKHCRGTCS